MTTWNLPAGLTQGRPLHVIVGFGITILMVMVAGFAHQLQGWYAPLTNTLTVLGVALAHEQAPSGNGPKGDVEWSDFLTENGGPLNGVLDVVTFLPGPALWWAIWASQQGTL